MRQQCLSPEVRTSKSCRLMTEYEFGLRLNAVLQLTTHYSLKDWRSHRPFVLKENEIQNIYTFFGISYVYYIKDNVDYVALVSRRDAGLKKLKMDRPHLSEPFLTLKNLNVARINYLPNSISIWLWCIIFFINMGLAVFEDQICEVDMYCGLKVQLWNVILMMTISVLVPFLLYYWRARNTKSNVTKILLKTEVMTLVFIALLVSGWIITSDARTGTHYTQLFKARNAIFSHF